MRHDKTVTSHTENRGVMPSVGRIEIATVTDDTKVSDLTVGQLVDIVMQLGVRPRQQESTKNPNYYRAFSARDGGAAPSPFGSEPGEGKET
jgi:hypothetical protein